MSASVRPVKGVACAMQQCWQAITARGGADANAGSVWPALKVVCGLRFAFMLVVVSEVRQCRVGRVLGAGCRAK